MLSFPCRSHDAPPRLREDDRNFAFLAIFGLGLLASLLGVRTLEVLITADAIDGGSPPRSTPRNLPVSPGVRRPPLRGTAADETMKYEKPEYELPIPGVAWTRGAGHPAGVFLLDGRCYFVALDSPAERVLVEGGALHMANVRFDPEPLERSHPKRSVRLVEPAVAARWLGSDPRVEETAVRRPGPRFT